MNGLPAGARLTLRLLAVGLFLTGAWLAATRPISVTWLNAGPSIAYPPAAARWALAAALAGGLWPLGLGRGPRLAGAVVAGLALLSALHLLRYRVVVEGDGLSQHGLFGTTTLPWRSVTRIEQGTRVIVVWGAGDEQIRVDATPFAAVDRERFERTLARHIREVSAR